MVDFSIDMPRLLSPGVVNVERPSSAPALPTGDKLASVSCNKTQSIVKEVRSEVLEANVMLQCSCLHNISPSVRNVRRQANGEYIVRVHRSCWLSESKEKRVRKIIKATSPRHNASLYKKTREESMTRV